MQKERDWRIFITSIFFVLGFSSVFAIVGILLQTVLLSVSFTVQTWLARIGGLFIVLFGLYLIGLINLKFLQKEHKFHVKKLNSSYLSAFLFGAAFAVGWSPCIGAILGAVFSLAITQPATAFFLLLAYSIGLGMPFLLVGLFTNQAQGIISKYTSKVKYLNYIFGAILISIGGLIMTNNLGMISSFPLASSFISNIGTISFGTSLNLGIAFLGGLVSFLSPCVLPLLPAFLTYLASEAVKKE